MKILLSVFMAAFVLTDCFGIEETDRPQEANIQKIDQKRQLSLDDIKKMTQLGITDDKIIDTIKSTGSVYYLTGPDSEELKNAGVSKRVINYMSKTGDQ